MNKRILAALAVAATVVATAQTKITFDTADYGALGVYDTWEESPFRLGKMKGNVRVDDNRFKDAEGNGVQNTSPKMLVVERSRFGSNTFGARIGLTQPLPTSEEPQYLHALVRREKGDSRVMLVGLGKRESFADEPDSIEQFWVVAEQQPVAGQWRDMVFPMRTVSGVRLYSLVIVPDLASPHELKDDFLCYIDEIEVNSNPQPRTSRGPRAAAAADTVALYLKPGELWGSEMSIDLNGDGLYDAAERVAAGGTVPTTVRPGIYRAQMQGREVMVNIHAERVGVNARAFNGNIRNAQGESTFQAPFHEDLELRVVAAPGFRRGSITVRHGYNLDGPQCVGGITQWHEETLAPGVSGTLTIPARLLDGDVSIVGEFVQEK